MLRLHTLIFVMSFSLFAGGCAVQPIPVNSVDEARIIKKEIRQLFAQQQPIEAPVTLYEAMARGIKYNLDHRVKLMEEVLAKGELEVARLELLPKLTLDAGYHDRNKISGSTSISLAGNNTGNPVFSTSQESQRNTGKIALVWNLLDFGVSYAQAQQQGDEILINGEKRRKVIQNIIHDVRYAYSRAVGAQELLPWMERIMGSLSKALGRIDSLEKLKLLPPLTYLNYRRELLETRLQLWQLREELQSARSELSALINIQPGVPFKLAVEDYQSKPIPEIRLSMEELEDTALINRPEIREEHYQRRISRTEIKKAMLRMLPGLELSFAPNYDSNRFLFHNYWNEFGIRVNWNLFNLFTGSKKIEAAKARVEVDKARSMALGMAVVTQVHLAHLRFQTALADYQISDQLAKVEEGIFKHTQASQKAEIQDELQVIRSEADHLLSQMNRHLSYAELQNAYGRLFNSVGIDPLPKELPDHQLDTVATALQERMNHWQELASTISKKATEPAQ